MKSDRDYSVYGNVAYAPERESRRRARTNTRVDTHSRPKAQVREAGEVAVVGVIGCALVIALALQVVNSYATLAASSDQVVQLNNQMQELQKQEAILRAQYEKTFDAAYLAQAVGDNMVRPGSSQVVYIDLSREDNVVVHQQESNWSKIFAK